MKNLKVFESFETKINEEDMPKTGMLVFVYRAAHGSDTTAGGLTSKLDQVKLVPMEGPFPPKADEDYLVLKEKNVGSTPYLYAVPKSVLDAGDHPMFGGNFVYTSDSRFHKVSKYPIPVHDRVEKSRMDH